MKKIITIMLALSSTVFADEIKLVSKSIQSGKTILNDQVFNNFGCTGKNISPDLKWSGEPKGTKSFAITMYDPDAPTGSGWWHWTIFNIPATVHELALGAGDSNEKFQDGSTFGRTDFGSGGYGGPCPPPGKPHRYIIKIYALKDRLPLNEEASGAMLGFYIYQNKIAEGKIESFYKR